MKHLILGIMSLALASVATAQTKTDWKTLLTTSGSKVIAVEGATRIDISTAKTLYERGVRFIDTRGSSAWKYGHIPGALAVHYPTEAELMGIVDKNEEVVFYCDCDVGSAYCNLSPHVSAKAVAWGYQNVSYFTTFNEWSAAGHPIEAGAIEAVNPPTVIEATSKGITLEKVAGSSTRMIYDAANGHCEGHGKTSSLISSASPRYVFVCY